MKTPEAIAAEHIATTRRYFLRLAAGSAAGIALPDLWAAGNYDHPALVKAIAELDYLTADADLLPAPVGDWGDMSGGKDLPPIAHQIGADGQPLRWPLTNAIVHFAALLTGVGPGDYEIRTRTIDANGVPQPLPRPFQKSGGNAIQQLRLSVKG